MWSNSSGVRKEVQLRVAEARQRDIGRKIARVDSRAIRELNLSPGDLIEINGKRTTIAIVWPPYKEDDGMGLIRIDGEVRRNAGVSVGEYVRISKANAKPATKIVLAPYETLPFVGDFARIVKSQLLNLPVMKGDTVVVPILGMGIELKVTSTAPTHAVIVSENTVVEVSTSPVKRLEETTGVTYEDIGGLHEELQRIREMIELPLKHPELFRHLGIDPPKGVILYGPPGTGKTLIAKAIANETGAHFISINGPEIMSKFYGESEARLREVFQEAEQNAPSIIFIDELDAIAPKRSEVTGEVERRVVSQLLALMDGLKGRGQVIVIGATNRIEAIDPALRRPGRFDREIRIGVPDRNGRKEILQIHTRRMPLAEDVDLDEIADITHGFTGADLAALCREAAMNALRRFLPMIDLEKEVIPAEILEQLKVTREDFANALRMIQPSALREVILEIPNVKWEDVGDLQSVKQELKEAVEWPLKYPEVFKRLGIRPPRGILLYGPPGTGKTLLAKAVATESEANFISVKGPEVLSKWVGESEKAVREIFRKARETAPCIIFFDELDAIAPRRGLHADAGVTDRIVNQLLTEMDGIQTLKGVVVIGASNRPDILDPALLRPGRFDRVIYVPPPDADGRYQIFQIHTREMPLSDDVDLSKLAAMTEGYTGADIEAVCREAAIMAMRENINIEKVSMRHFMMALEKIKPSITPEQKREYERILTEFRKSMAYIS
ncbi:MAG: CDC48 family AAA ATPase [Thaumarchaeota archaeon]|jgi:transitional endoplasmic reticulum ATPase|nr:CDC48 family AAA ATPase [Candidatus Geocrenenecus arthurdayi]MCL7391346.1 CDC48 family AAA ATPase [Candidatus Geocrenenecus arthurdayi]MCL7395954.1 CDC48 family AAA ATPase [Candidatus Geocrenenecus arthurdayi]MCL7402150.1 CDC48 family AAA ATPase [Candidatus Geocrenenecus arthurdayi]MCL7403838.1 CDC48 family AAA ATPase [Candidatus Geocrenenecus arthurdayi]